jgi:predicted glycogen debranching enzyme
VDLSSSTSLEWLETNGLGGFSSSTIIGLNTRRYHGLLTAALNPPGGRVVLLSKVEETLVVNGRRYELSANQYPGVVHPRGFEYQESFRLEPFPVFVYRIDDMDVEKRVFMVHGENTTVIEYVLPGGQAELEVRPLIAFRDYHSMTHKNGAIDPAVDCEHGVASVKPYQGLPALFFAHDATALQATGDWYYNFEYVVERERGLDFREDLFNPFVLRFSGPAATIIASTKLHKAADAASLRDDEIRRRAAIAEAAPSRRQLVQQLTSAADHFIVKRGELKTIIAGYHWFTDWGRDTMIALPGLTLVTGRYQIARDILRAFAASVDQGMVPNRFTDTGEAAEYNAVDATLWFLEAIRAYTHYTGDYQFVREHLYETLKDIVRWHIQGTRYGIRVDSDGLLACGEPGVQLTWMDSKIGDWVVTPRTGKPVEIQALWYNAVRIMQDFAGRFADPHLEILLRELADLARKSFNGKFWNEETGCLYDVIDGADRDASMRPNQIFAAGLHYPVLTSDRARSVVDAIERDLLTPAGLRTLSPADSRYRPTYDGGVVERDSAYHQGTVWPWLMGPFVSAFLRVHGDRERAAALIEGFDEHLRTAGLGHISEIADGEYPHTPRGCIAQAWSTAELLRAAVEGVYCDEPVRAATAGTFAKQ